MTLFVDELVSIGMVDGGDNPEAHIQIWKRREPEVEGATVTETLADSDIAKQESDMSDFDLTTLPDEARAFVDGLIAERDEAVAASLAPASDPVDGDEDIVKSAPEEVQALVKSLQAQVEAQATEVRAEITKRRDTEFIAKAKADGMERLLGKAEEMGPMLRRLDDADHDAYEAIYGALLAAAQRVDLAKALAEFGQSPGETTPQDRKDAYITKRREAGDDRSQAEIEAEFWRQNPDLVREMRSMG